MATTTYNDLDLDAQLCFPLYAASRAMVRAYGPLLERVGLTYPQYVTMLALWGSLDQPMTVGELGRRLHLDTGTLTPLLKRLERLGYLHRVRDAADERRVHLEVSGRGLVLRDEVASIPRTLYESLGMNPADVVALRGRLKELVNRFEALEGRSVRTSEPSRASDDTELGQLER